MSSTSETSRSSQISRVPYLPGLDGLRALAVIAVIVYHANSSWLPGGYLGVEVFFVISGYLITLLLVAESERTGAIQLRQFWVRRARRLLPALFTMLVLLIFWTAFFERDALGKLRGDVVAGVVYGSNWFQIWIGAGYTAVNDFAPLRHLWSLAVEEQFYLLWPLVMLAVLRRGHDRLPRVAMWFVGVAVGIAAAMAILMPTSSIGRDCVATPDAYWQIAGRCVSRVDALYLSTPTRAIGLLLGAALALVWRPYALLRGPMKHKGPMLDPVAIVGLGIVGMLAWKVHIVHTVVDEGTKADPWLFRGGLFLTGIGSLLVIAAVAHKKAFAGRVLGNPVLRVIGERSYGLYLFHWPVFQSLRHETGIALKPHEFVGAMIVTIAITEVSYRYIELPIRERRLRESLAALLRAGPGALRRRGSFGAIVSAAVLLPVFAGVSLVTAELKQNDVQASLEEGEQSVTDVLTEVGSTTTAPTDTQPSGSVAPVTTAAPKRYDVFAIGDSVMKGAAPSLAELGIVVDAQQDRQARMGAAIFQQLEDLGVIIDVAVVHLGTNGPVSQETFDLLMAATDQIPRVIVLTLTANRDWTADNNAKIRALPEGHPNVTVLDWQLVSELCTGECFTADRIHLDRDGMRFYAAEIWKAMGRELPSDW
jgi:peptidoglycan/LPS O-acetylase OafA/YrhL